MRLVLIRHGESQHSKLGIIAGVSGCPGLTEHGILQAQSLVNRLKETRELDDATILLSSPVPRARQTAEILARELPIRTVEFDCNLCELHPGEADGLTWEEYRTRFGTFDLQAEPDRHFAPSGESWSEMYARVRSTLGRLAERFDGKTVVAVTHAGFIVLSMLELFQIPTSGGRAWLEPSHASLTEWQISNDGWRLERYNDTYHLVALH
jgi:broad specificity phosphatase PhoE